MKNHEKKCTMNPERVCNMCVKLENEQRPMEELLAALPDPKQFVVTDHEFDEYVKDGGEFSYYKGHEEWLSEAMPRLHQLTGNCPVCLLAALRQKGFPLPVQCFDYKKELADALQSCNEEPSYH
jgi:hypothetical protein